MSEDNESWRDSLPEALRDAPYIGKAETPEQAMEALVHAAQLQGTSIRIPNADADDDTKNTFYEKLKAVDGVARLPLSDDEEGLNELFTKLGKPAEYTEYKLPELEDFAWDETIGQQLREYALEAGMTTAQFTKFATKIGEQERTADTTSGSEAEARKAALRADWGETLEEREALIRGWMELSEAPTELRDLLEARDLPLATMNWLHGIAKEFKGEVAPMSKEGDREKSGTTPAEAREQITTIMRELTTMRETDPRYNDLKAKLLKMNRVASAAAAA